jgi:membrane glycosyltransferase
VRKTVIHGTTVKDPPGGRASTAARSTAFLFVFLFICGSGILLFADFLWRTGLYGLKYGLLALHAFLFALITYVFCTVLFGFLSVRLGWLAPDAETEPSVPLPPTVVVFPIHDEEVASVMAHVEAVWRSLQRTGREKAFHLFVLSDSLNPDRWIEEEIAWFHVVRRLRAAGHVHYRHRSCNEGLKAGNLTDFLERWGGIYRYMIVFDADSLMSGERMVELVRRMEARPQIGILQTIPGAIRARSLYARTQQFASRLYSRLFMAGMDFRQAGDAVYFGHNAIIRVQPFMDNCRLPSLPWREPLGGQIYSHDFVEAALMRRAGWDVCIAHDPDGSYEEAPVNMLESVTRNRRWCQGNLQHAWLLFSRDLPPASRCSFLMGILAYISSLLWLLFLLFSTLVVLQFKRSGLSLITTSGFTPLADISLFAHGALLFGLSIFLLFSPKLLCLIDLLCEPPRRRLFGGGRRAITGVLFESLFAILAAPMFMLWHSWFVLTILLGKSSGWSGQKRSPRQSLSWRDAARSHGWMTLTGLAWELLVLAVNPGFSFWMLPVLAPLIFSIPLNVLFSSVSVGDRQRRAGLLQTPEELDPPQELRELAEAETQIRARLRRIDGSIAVQAIVDPYVNALHGELQLQPHMAESRDRDSDGQLARLLLSKGPSALNRDQLFTLLLDGAACRRVHLQLWHTPDAGLAPEWQTAIAAYAPNSKPPLLNGI